MWRGRGAFSTPELRAHPESGQPVLPDDVQGSHLSNRLDVHDELGGKGALGGPSSLLTSRAPGTSSPGATILWPLPEHRLREAESTSVSLLDPAVGSLVHIWHSTNIDGSELKQHE